MSKYFLFHDGDFGCNYIHDKHPSKSDFAMHTHDLYELYIFIGGHGIFHVEGNAYPLSPGDIMIMKPAESHYIDIDPTQPYTRIAIHFHKNIVSSMMDADTLLLPFTGRTAGTLNRYPKSAFRPEVYDFLISNIIADVPDRKQQILTNLPALLNELYVRFQSLDRESADLSLEQEIIRYINNSITAPITLDALCSIFYISKSKLCKLFKASTGTTVQKYVQTKRLLKAKQLLNTGMLPGKAAELCGYSDYSCFYRAYIKEFKTPPKENYIKEAL